MTTSTRSPSEGRSVLVISPPFYSHAKPLSVLARALANSRAQVTFACIPKLRHLVQNSRVAFFPFESTSNRNTGSGGLTQQSKNDLDRLHSFLRATRRGAVAALISQAENRQTDMSSGPRAILKSVERALSLVRPDWCIVDQLNYPVTLALHSLRAPFVSFVAGHPTDLPPDTGSCFGVPDQWPQEIHVDDVEFVELTILARQVEQEITDSLNDLLRSVDASATPIRSVFSFSSRLLRVFNYPERAADYPRNQDRDLFIGHCSAPRKTLPSELADRLGRHCGRPRVMIAFGTFQWVHSDVIRTVHTGITSAYPDASVLISAGDRMCDLSDVADERTLVCDFLPQPDLLRHVDLFVHHGGNNSFTESLMASVPTVVLPFAADQFAVANDIAMLGLGRVLDPNHLHATQVSRAVVTALERDTAERVAAMAAHVLSRGPHWAAEQMLARMACV